MDINLENTFTEIYQNRSWNSPESVSGKGSEIEQTKKIIEELPILYSKLGIKTVLDIPCGDYNWMNLVDNREVNYIGGDIVKDLIEDNRKKYPTVNFQHLDLVNSELPKADLIITRDVFVHMKYDMIEKAINNIIRSGSRYMLTTSFTSEEVNRNLGENGQWRPLNFLISPFYFNPIYLINEECTEGNYSGGIYNDKCLILFDLSKLKVSK